MNSCQDLSLAGKGAGIKVGTRSGLLLEVERLLDECNELSKQNSKYGLPKILVMENVSQVHSSADKGGTSNLKAFLDWQRKLEKLGYSNYWKDINAKHHGIPQNRVRTIMVSILGDYQYDFPMNHQLKHCLADYEEKGDVDKKYYLSESMMKYIVASTDNYQNNGKLIINPNVANTITCHEGRTRCNESTYLSRERESMTCETNCSNNLTGGNPNNKCK